MGWRKFGHIMISGLGNVDCTGPLRAGKGIKIKINKNILPVPRTDSLNSLAEALARPLGCAN